MSRGDETCSLNGVMAGYEAGNAKIESVCCICIDGEAHNSTSLCFGVHTGRPQFEHKLTFPL